MNPRTVLLNLIQERYYLNLLMILIVSLINWTIFVKLGFKLGNYPIPLKKALPWSLLLAITTVFAKPYIDEMMFTLFMSIIPILAFILVGKMHPLKSIAIMIIITLLDLAGLTLVNIPLKTIAPHISSFLLSNPDGLGIVAGTVNEFAIPLIILILSNRIDFSRQFFKKKYSGIEVGMVIVAVALFVILYYALLEYFYSLDKVIRYLAVIKMAAGWIFTLGSIYVLIKVKLRDQQQMKDWEEFLVELEISDAKKEVLKLKLSGMTNEEIAKRRGVAISTVKTQVNELRKEVDYDSIAEQTGAPVKKAGRPSAQKK